MIDFDPVEAEKTVYRRDLAAPCLAMAIHDGELRAWINLAARNAANAELTDEAVVVERADLHLERPFQIHWRAGYAFDNGLEQRRHVAVTHIVMQRGVTAECGSVDGGEVQLFIAGTERVEQVECFVEHPVGAGAVTVDFV